MYKQIFYTDDLENIIEELLFEELDKIIKSNSLDFCTCEVCIQDIAAIVLNKTDPLYKNNIVDKRFPSEREQVKLDKIRAEIRERLLNSIDLVNKNPHH